MTHKIIQTTVSLLLLFAAMLLAQGIADDPVIKDLTQQMEALAADMTKYSQGTTAEDSISYWTLKAQYDGLRARKDARIAELDADAAKRRGAINNYNQGNEYYKDRKYADAIDSYRESIKYDDTNYQVYRNLGKAYFQNKQYQESVDALQEGLSLNPDDPNMSTSMGRAQVKMQQYDNAIASFNHAIAADSTYAVAWMRKGSIYLIRKDYGRAESILKIATRLDPKSSSAFYNLGRSQSEQGKISEALNAFTNAVNIKSDLWKANYERASMLNKLGKHQEAIQAANECLKHRRNYAGAYFEIGTAYKKLGNRINAEENFKKCLNDRSWQSRAQWELDHGLKEAFQE